MLKTVLFQTIQFSIQNQFYFKQFSLALVHNLVLFDPLIGSYQVLPLWARVDLGAMVIKEYSAFPKAPVLLEPHSRLFSVIIQDTCWWGSYLSAEKQLVYSTTPADWANRYRAPTEKLYQSNHHINKLANHCYMTKFSNTYLNLEIFMISNLRC